MELTATARLGYERLFAQMKIRPERQAAAVTAAKKIEAGRARYEAVELLTGVPWEFIGVLHIRESDGDFSTFLGNGQPLDKMTTAVPAGMGPFHTWEEGAVSALKLKGLDQIKDWDLARLLYECERFNGFGYVSHRINSPYVWSWSTLYTTGKYDVDSHFAASLTDKQPGCAVMLAALQQIGAVTLPQPQTPQATTKENTMSVFSELSCSRSSLATSSNLFCVPC